MDDEVDADHEHEEGESHYVNTPLDDEVDEIEVEVEQHLMQCVHLDIYWEAEIGRAETINFGD